MDPFAGYGLPPISNTPDTTLDRMVESVVLSKKQMAAEVANVSAQAVADRIRPVSKAPAISLFKPMRPDPPHEEQEKEAPSEDDDQLSMNLDSGELIVDKKEQSAAAPSSSRTWAAPSVVTNRKRSGLGEPIHLLPFSVKEGEKDKAEMPVSIDWRKFYLDHRLRLETRRELLPLAETRDIIRTQLQSYVSRWSNSALHQRQCPAQIEKVFQRLPPSDSDTVPIMIAERLEKFTCRLEDVAFDPRRDYAMDYEAWAKISCNVPEEIVPYTGAANERLHFVLPFAPELEMQLLQSVPSDTIWNQIAPPSAVGAAPKPIDPLDTKPYYAVLSFDTLSDVSSENAAFDKMADLWTGPAFPLLEELNPPMVFFGEKQIGEITGMNQQNIRGSHFRAIVMFIGQLEALSLPSLRTLLVPDEKSDATFDSCVFPKNEDPSRYFPSDDAYRLFVYQHACVLNAIVAEELHRLIDKIVPAPLLEKLTSETGAPSKDHVLKFVRNYISFRYVYVHRLVACCSAFYDYLFNPGMSRLLLQNLSINMQSTIFAPVSQKAVRVQLIRKGGLCTNPIVYNQIKSKLLDISQEEKLRLSPFRLHAIAILRAYHTQSKFSKTSEDRRDKLLLTDHLPVGMLLQKPLWRRINSVEDTRIREKEFCVWTLQPLPTCCAMDSQYESDLRRHQSLQPWSMWDQCLHTEAYAHGTIKQNRPGPMWMQAHLPAITEIISTQATRKNWQQEDLDEWQAGCTGRQLISVAIAYYNHLKGENIFWISQYVLNYLSSWIRARETEKARKNCRYVIHSDSPLAKWLNNRPIDAVIEAEIEKQNLDEPAKQQADEEQVEDIIESAVQKGQVKPPRKKRIAPGELSEEAKLAKQEERKIYMRLYQREHRKQKALEKGKIIKPRGENKRKKKCTVWRVKTGLEGPENEEGESADQFPVTNFE